MAGAVRGTLQIYPPPPLAEPSGSYGVRVLGREVFVERYADVSYARLGVKGPVTVRIEVAKPIEKQLVFPSERVTFAAVSDTVLTIELASPESVVIWIDDLEKLFLLPDRFEDGAPEPGSPGVFEVTEFGADPTGSRLATHELQAAIDAAARPAGGGTVLVPRGLFRTGTLTLKSNVTLYLARGALLAGSRDPGDYPVDPGRHESGSDAALPADVRYLGRTMTFSRLLLVDRAHDVRICGYGTIDGEGTFLRTQHNAVPNLLRVRESTRVRVTDVLFRNSAAWSLHVLASRDIEFSNVKVLNDRANLNTDGIDVDMSTNVRIDVFEGADEAHAVDGLTLRRFVVNGESLRDAASAESVANLTVGPHVRKVAFE